MAVHGRYGAVGCLDTKAGVYANGFGITGHVDRVNARKVKVTGGIGSIRFGPFRMSQSRPG